MKRNAVLIEDETAARDHFIKTLGQITSDIRIITSIASVEDAISWFTTNPSPDLIFMDIQLSDGLSFDILQEIEIEVPIIFVTAYDQYAIQAFKTTGIDYLLKPIVKDDLENALDKFFKTSIQPDDELGIKSIDLAQNVRGHYGKKYRERFLLKSGQNMIPVTINEIAYFYRDKLVFAQLFDGRSFVLDYSLHQLQHILDPKICIRLNRQVLVHIDAIKKLQTTKPGQLRITLQPQFHEEICLSPERSRYIKLILNET